MEYFYGVLAAGVVAVISLQLAWWLEFAATSSWDEYQRAEAGVKSKAGKLAEQRWRAYPVIKSLLVVKLMLESGLLLFLIQQMVGEWWLVAIWWVMAVIVGFGLGKLKLVHTWAMRIYTKNEARILQVCEKITWVSLKMFQPRVVKPPKISSREEFAWLVENDKVVLGEVEKAIIQASERFCQLKAQDLMIKLEELTSVEADELLGPLKINELYETGELVFLVKAKQAVVGLIDLEELVNLKSGKSYKAQDLARKDYLEVAIKDNLTDIISQMLAQRTQLAIVANSRQVLGIIKLETILKQLKITNL